MLALVGSSDAPELPVESSSALVGSSSPDQMLAHVGPSSGHNEHGADRSPGEGEQRSHLQAHRAGDQVMGANCLSTESGASRASSVLPPV